MQQISKKDKSLIDAILARKRMPQDTSYPVILSVIVMNQDYFKSKLKGKALINLAAGEKGYDAALHLLGLKKIENIERPMLDLGIDKIVLVDPFVSLEEMKKQALSAEPNPETSEKIEYRDSDALAYLLAQPDESANILISSFDFDITDDPEYLKRIAEEAHRVVPHGGLFIVNNCPDIEKNAEKLFKKSPDIGILVYAFEK